MLRGKTLIVVVLTVFFVGVGAVAAGAETQTVHHGTDTFADYIPCVTEFPSLDGFEITVTYNSVERFSDTGGDHGSFHQTGTASAVPVVLADEDGDGEPDFDEEIGSFAVAGPREGESFTGKFKIHGTFNATPSGTFTDTFTFSGHASGDEGTTVHWNDLGHFTADGDPGQDPDAIIRAAFEQANCH
jgi:hypothetical protein